MPECIESHAVIGLPELGLHILFERIKFGDYIGIIKPYLATMLLV